VLVIAFLSILFAGAARPYREIGEGGKRGIEREIKGQSRQANDLANCQDVRATVLCRVIGCEGRIGSREDHPCVRKVLPYHRDGFCDALPPEGRESLDIDFIRLPRLTLESEQLCREGYSSTSSGIPGGLPAKVGSCADASGTRRSSIPSRSQISVLTPEASASAMVGTIGYLLLRHMANRGEDGGQALEEIRPPYSQPDM
jgi:hypothetical protein